MFGREGFDCNFGQYGGSCAFGHSGSHHHHPEEKGSKVSQHCEQFFRHSAMFGRDLASAPRRFLVPSLLLLLAEKPSHGYAIMNNLVDMNVISPETPMAIVYRTLRFMEMEGLTVSDQVEGEGKGPARKVYRLTDAGREALDLWSTKLKSMGTIITEFQKRYESLRNAG